MSDRRPRHLRLVPAPPSQQQAREDVEAPPPPPADGVRKRAVDDKILRPVADTNFPENDADRLRFQQAQVGQNSADTESIWIFATDVRHVDGTEGDWLRGELITVVRDLLAWARGDLMTDQHDQGRAA